MIVTQMIMATDNTNGTRGDAFHQDGTEWSDMNAVDGDTDYWRWNDTDGDGYGDNINGNRGDVFHKMIQNGRI